MMDVTLNELVKGLERQGEKYQALDVFAWNVRELREASETSRLGSLKPVDGSHVRAFTFEQSGKNYHLRLHESGVARLTRTHANPTEPAGSVALNALHTLKGMVGPSTNLPEMVLGFLVGAPVGTSPSPRHVLTIRYDEQEGQWRAYDGPLAKWMRESALKAETARG